MVFYGLVFVCIVSALPYVDCGQCCSEYTDLTGETHSAQWCSNYCCLEPSLTKLAKYDCCDDETLAVIGQTNVEDFCADWFVKNVWAPILIALFCIGLISCVTCCCCCGCCACCRNKPTPGGIVMTSPAATSVVVMSTTSDPRRYGYDQP